MNYTFFGKNYDENSILPELKQKIEFLQAEQKHNVQQLNDLITPLSQLVSKLEEIGFAESEEDKKQRESYTVIMKEKTDQGFAKFKAEKENNCQSFEALIKGVEHDVVAINLGNMAVKKIFDLIDDYVNNKRVSLLKSLIDQMQYYIDNKDYATCYDCYQKAFDKFTK